MAIKIWSLMDLQAMQNDLDADYELAANIDASATSEWNGGAGFVPVGTLAIPFTGTFDAKHYEISDLSITRATTDEVGLFGATDGATITKVRIVDCNITGAGKVGTMIGDTRNSTTTDCQSTGEVTGSDHYVGGLIGFLAWCVITKCNSKCVVNGNDFVGGFAGWAYDSTLSQCFASGAVSGDDYISGFLGVSQENDIDDCYARGAVSGDDFVAGFIAYSYPATETIDNCYSTGAVTGNTNVGGLMGFSSSTIGACFWDMEASGQLTSDGGIGKTTAQMKDMATFFDVGWNIVDSAMNRNNGYPFLGWEIDDLANTWLIYVIPARKGQPSVRTLTPVRTFLPFRSNVAVRNIDP